jgi:hypothetical protein
MLKTTTTTEDAVTLETPTEYVSDTLLEEISRVCTRIPPLWDLSNYVAVNPFLGFSDQPMPDVARQVRDGLGGRLLPGIEFYQARWGAGAFGYAELEQAATRARQSPETLAAILGGQAPMPTRTANEVLTFAERHDQQYGTDWQNTVVRHTALWCAVQVPEGETRWLQAQERRGLYASWREAAQVDWSLQIAGLKGWRKWARNLPEEPVSAIATMLGRLDVEPAQREEYLYRLLGGVFGWASFLRRSTWAMGSTEPGVLADLLAIRICTDAAVAELARRPFGASPKQIDDKTVDDEAILAIFQEALEDGYARRTLGSIKEPPQPTSERPAVQAAFCIDVRSEVMRRHLEAQSPAIQTIGFAGFFGVTLEWNDHGAGSARCPVLLAPSVSLQSLAPEPGKNKYVLKDVQQAPSAFTYVETLGLAYGLRLAGEALNWVRTFHNDEGQAPFSLQANADGTGVPLATRIQMGAAILKNIGFRETFGRLVLFCGHGSTTENNSHAAGLDCGACGGHGGAINARVAALLLNDPDVRAGLVEHGWTIPVDTCFVPGQHDTTMDEVTLFDTEHIPASHAADLDQLKSWLALAGADVRAERAAGLGLKEHGKGSLLDRLVKQRAHDWSEVRPEWALARNAAFIAARRERTRGVDLGGRSFLHDYDWQKDPDNSILTLILSAPMVVASWINLQYFASTVDNDMFGCGTKALQNRLGSLGVVLGNGGDLRTGLALQSVQAADGSWYHEPLRLQVVVEAPTERIEAVMNAVPTVNDLIENGWVRIFALDPEGTTTQRWVSGVGWQTT